MRFLAGVSGVFILALVLVDSFNCLLLARRTEHRFRIAPIFYRLTWKPFSAVGRKIQSSRRRESFLGIYGPLSLVLLFGLWAIGLVLAFGLLQWAFHMQPEALPDTFGNDLYLSAATLFTLSSGNPQNAASKLVTVLEGGLGFTFLGLVVAYLPVLYQSFSNRELRISLLDVMAGSPPSAGALLQCAPENPGKLEDQLEVWEQWSAQVLENQMSFPMLAYFRSQHANQAWLTALAAMVDCSAVICICSKGDLQRQAKMTFAMGRHVLADLAAVFRLQNQMSHRPEDARLSEADFAALQEVVRGKPELLDADLCTPDRLRGCRRLYETESMRLSEYFLMALPAWIPNANARGNWRAELADATEVPFGASDPFAEPSVNLRRPR